MKQFQEKQRVLLGLDGRVKSSVTAAVLKNQGYEVVGLYLHLAKKDDPYAFRSRCSSQVPFEQVHRFCERLGIGLHSFHAEDIFEDRVVDTFVSEILQQRLPNPCIQCNYHLRFRYLLEKADELGCPWIATGHYAQVIRDFESNQVRLLRALDRSQDQSYYLYPLDQALLRRTLFPLGGLTLLMIERLALELKVDPDPSLKVSQKICFISDPQYSDFIRGKSATSLRGHGVVKTVDGKVLGKHEGLYPFIYGQKIEFSTEDEEFTDLYVVGFDSKDNALIVGPQVHLYQKEMIAVGTTWIRPMDQLRTLSCEAQVHPQGMPLPCRVTCFENATVQVMFESPTIVPAPGQAIVFYQGNELLGGATIQRIGAKQEQ